jgi:hypothetical protein
MGSLQLGEDGLAWCFGIDDVITFPDLEWHVEESAHPSVTLYLAV